MRKVSVSIGICAYNEEKNIGKLLEQLLRQRTNVVDIREILVISSGSTDRTDDIVRQFSEKDSRIKLIRQERREGKASAVNVLLKNVSQPVCVLESADTIPSIDAIEMLCRPFLDPQVGMTGGRPIPINSRDGFMGLVGWLLWTLHHRISLRNPKMGELIAFRRVVDAIPEDTVVDEYYLQTVIRGMGYKLVYVPEAIVYNKAPSSIADFLSQRRRIYAGYLQAKNKLGHMPSTMNFTDALCEATHIVFQSPSRLPAVLFAMALEAVARLLGVYDYYRGRRHHVWQIAATTKNLELA